MEIYNMNTEYHIHMTKFEDIKGGSQYSGWTTLSSGDVTVNNLLSDLDLWPWKSIGFQTLLRTKYVPSSKLGTYLVLRESGTLLIFKVKGQGDWVKFLPHNILVNTLESTSFNGFGDLDLWPWKSIVFQTL
jgi:hypothetical protein